jgi:hypothetical protein
MLECYTGASRWRRVLDELHGVLQNIQREIALYRKNQLTVQYFLTEYSYCTDTSKIVAVNTPHSRFLNGMSQFPL